MALIVVNLLQIYHNLPVLLYYADIYINDKSIDVLAK